MTEFDHDFAIVGSRFVGSVSALRLSEKGYSVVVLEMGKRWKREDFPKSTWDVRKYLWRPWLGMSGTLQMTVVKDASFLHGAGVGGGSLVHANTISATRCGVAGTGRSHGSSTAIAATVRRCRSSCSARPRRRTSSAAVRSASRPTTASSIRSAARSAAMISP